MNTPNRSDTRLNISSREPVIRRSRSNPVIETPNADKIIQNWRNKIKDESSYSSTVTNTSLFDFLSPIVPIYSQTSRRYIQPTPQRHLGTSFSYIRNTQYTILLIVGILLVIFGLYFTLIQSSTIALPPGVSNSLCAIKNLEGLDCDAEQKKTQNLYSSLVLEIQDKYIKKQCENSDIKHTMETQTVFEYISTYEHMPSREIEELIKLFIGISKNYSNSPIGFDNNVFNINLKPNLPILCVIKNIFVNMFCIILWLGVVALSIVSLYFGICYVTTKSEKHRQEVNRLVEATIDLLKQQAQYRPNEGYLPIIHIRDQLIPLNERQAKSKIWAEVEQYFTESESRVRSGVQQIDGEDFNVWKWVQPESSSSDPYSISLREANRKIQPAIQQIDGENFRVSNGVKNMSSGLVKKACLGQTNEDVIISPELYPATCLKIRHMFCPDGLIQVHSKTHAIKSILKKCNNVGILDMSVVERCVYVQCASRAEAGKVYRLLQGFRYNGNLVSVKFMRLENYLKRFPNAITTAKCSKSSNNDNINFNKSNNKLYYK